MVKLYPIISKLDLIKTITSNHCVHIYTKVANQTETKQFELLPHIIFDMSEYIDKCYNKFLSETPNQIYSPYFEKLRCNVAEIELLVIQGVNNYYDYSEIITTGFNNNNKYGYKLYYSFDETKLNIDDINIVLE